MNRIRAGLNIGLYMLLNIIMIFIMGLTLNPESTYFITNSIKIYVMFNVIIMGILLVVNHKYFEKEFRLFKKAYIKQSIVLYLQYFLVLTLVMGVLYILDLTIPSSDNQNSIEAMFTNGTIIYMVVLVGIVAPFTEEFIFRANLMYLIGGEKLMESRIKIISSVVISILIFAGLHVITEIKNMSLGFAILSAIPYIILSICLCYIFIKNKASFTASMTFHMLVNSIAVLMLLISMGV